MATQAERADATRAALIGAARAAFAEHGFAAASTERIVEAAGVTRGALYHHFPGKTDLFAAVFEQVEAELASDAVAAVPQGASPLEAMEAACLSFLDRCLDPAIRRIALLDGIAVLGFERWREIESRYALGLVTAGLAAAMEAGEIEPAPLDPLAHMLLAVTIEGGLLIGHAEHPRRARREVGETVRWLLARLRK